MSDLVPAEDIERIVGILRHPTKHFGRAVSSEETVYILHSKRCLDSGIDLRDCSFSEALDRGYEPGCKHCGYDFWTGRVGGGGYAEVREYLCIGCDCPKYRCDSYGSRRKCCPDCRHTDGAGGLVDAR